MGSNPTLSASPPKTSFFSSFGHFAFFLPVSARDGSKSQVKKLIILEAELLILDFEDEAIVETTGIEGPIVLSRTDADRRAVLAVTITRGKPAPAPAAKLGKHERNSAKHSVAAKLNKAMSEHELIEAFGDSRLMKVIGE